MEGNIDFVENTLRNLAAYKVHVYHSRQELKLEVLLK